MTPLLSTPNRCSDAKTQFDSGEDLVEVLLRSVESYKHNSSKLLVNQRLPKGAGKLVPCQKVSKIFLTLFDEF